MTRRVLLLLVTETEIFTHLLLSLSLLTLQKYLCSQLISKSLQEAAAMTREVAAGKTTNSKQNLENPRKTKKGSLEPRENPQKEPIFSQEAYGS